jgi:hypothetical protein
MGVWSRVKQERSVTISAHSCRREKALGYVLKNADLTKYTVWLHGLPEDTDRELLNFMNLQRGEEIHGKGLDVTAKLEPVPPIVLIRSKPNRQRSSCLWCSFFRSSRIAHTSDAIGSLFQRRRRGLNR